MYVLFLLLPYFSMVVSLMWLYHHMLSVSYISRGSWVFCHLSLCTLMSCANNRVHYNPMVILFCFHTTLPHYHHYVDLSESIELSNAFQVHSVSSVCRRLSQLFSCNMWLWAFSLSISFMMILGISILYLIIIIKSEK